MDYSMKGHYRTGNLDCTSSITTFRKALCIQSIEDSSLCRGAIATCCREEAAYHYHQFMHLTCYDSQTFHFYIWFCLMPDNLLSPLLLTGEKSSLAVCTNRCKNIISRARCQNHKLENVQSVMFSEDSSICLKRSCYHGKVRLNTDFTPVCSF